MQSLDEGVWLMNTGIPTTDKAFVVTRQPVRWAVHRSTTVLILCLTIGIGAAVCALLGLLSPVDPTVVQTTRGGLIDLYGAGIYRYDSLFAGAGNRGTDAVTLAIALPLLVVSVWRFRGGSPRWHLILTGVLLWFLYVYATLAVGAAFNPLFLVYVAVFGASLWCLVLAARGFDRNWLGGLLDQLPRRWPAVFLITSGVLTTALWCTPVLVAQLAGSTPDRLDGYTTLVTVAVDTAVIAPAAVVAGLLIWRRRASGYLAAIPLLVLEGLLAPLIVAQTISQLRAGVDLAPGEVVGPVVGFGILALAAAAVLWTILRRIPSSISVIRCATAPGWKIADNAAGAP
jgi:hypothetical protein